MPNIHPKALTWQLFLQDLRPGPRKRFRHLMKCPACRAKVLQHRPDSGAPEQGDSGKLLPWRKT